MKKLLIVCPRFPPTNAADSHRTRLSLPYYTENGWEPTVLAAEDDDSGQKDHLLAESLPNGSRVVRVRIWPEWLCRKVGFGQIDYRSFFPFLVTGIRLFRRTRFDVVLFSSTVFLSFILGPIWKRLYGCKVVYDYQDPWYYGDEQPYTKETVPGAWWKFRLTQIIAGVLEPIALKAADHIISVSQGYVETLRTRYPFLSNERFTVLPFPASTRDYEFVDLRQVHHTIFPADGKVHWVYAGRGGHDMQLALRALFGQLAILAKTRPELRASLNLHFVGTSYAPAGRGRKTIEPIAEQFGVADMIAEQLERIPYFETLSLYRESDLVLIIGSEAPDYTASKLFNCVLAGRKVLALFHRDSLVATLAKDIPNLYLATFDPGSDTAAFEADVMRGLLWALSKESNLQRRDDRLLAPWLADNSTRTQCEVFNSL
jgi:hypothetical protein